MDVGDTVVIIDHSNHNLYEYYVGRLGEITEELPNKEVQDGIGYVVELDDGDVELFKEEEMVTVDIPEGFERIELDLPESLWELLKLWSDETGLSRETLIRYALTDYIVRES